MQKITLPVIALELISMCACAQTRPLDHKAAAAAQTQSRPVYGHDCTTEPNGDKIWYPEMTPFYPEGSQVQFETWPTICRAGRWVTDDATAKAKNDMDRPRRKLLNAAQTRILTADELRNLMAYGPYIFTQEMVSFRQDEIDRKFSDLLKFQQLLRMAATDKTETTR